MSSDGKRSLKEIKKKPDMNFYKLLEVDRKTTPEAIKKQFKQLS